MVIECCGYDQILDCLHKVFIKGEGLEKLANIYVNKYGNNKVCIKVDGNMHFEGYCHREYFESKGYTVYSFDEVFGVPEDFGQMTLYEILGEEILSGCGKDGVDV